MAEDCLEVGILRFTKTDATGRTMLETPEDLKPTTVYDSTFDPWHETHTEFAKELEDIGPVDSFDFLF